MDFYKILKSSHSGLRWLVLLFLVVAIVNAFMKWQTKGKHTKSDRMLAMFAMAVTHIQIVIGLIMYFISPRVNFNAPFAGEINRFYTVEHISMMIIAAVLLTLGYSRAKRLTSSKKKFRTIFIFYLLGLILILLAIPWPFRFPWAGWY